MVLFESTTSAKKARERMQWPSDMHSRPIKSLLCALCEGIVELSMPKVAVGARLLPHEANSAPAPRCLGLVSSWFPVTGRTGEHLFALTGEGQNVYHALTERKSTPPVGTVVRLRRPFPSFAGWLSGQQFSSYVDIIPDELCSVIARKGTASGIDRSVLSGGVGGGYSYLVRP